MSFVINRFSVCFLVFFTTLALNTNAEVAGPCRRAVTLVQRAQEANRPADKEELFEQALELCTEMPEIHYNYGLFLSDEGEYRKAREEFLAAKEKEDRLEYRLAIARTFLAEKQLSEATDWYNGVLEQDRLHPAALQGLAIIAERSGDTEKATSLLDKAISLDPNDPVAHYNLGVIYEKRGLIEEAILQYEKANSIDPKHIASLFRSGLLLVKQGAISRAVVAFEKAADVDATDPRIFRALGVTYERLGRLQKAELAFRKALALDVSDDISRANLGLVLVRMKKPSQVIELFELQLVEKKEQLSVESCLALALASKDLGEYSEAEEFLRMGFKKDPKDKRLIDGFIGLYRESGEGEKEEKFEKLREELK
ncbi:MAG: tetratricopeptide repeat protein [Bdellovibrionales bacterium]|nr:tetratricopeptide repeat protein [Bdellovibrionales bacterium]